jgi:tripartite-type tricarboxylate transporter receptor subunit TctC
MRLPPAILCALLLAANSGSAAPLDACRSITFVVPFPPGSTTDSVSRLLSDRLGETLGRAVVVETSPAPTARSRRRT